MEDRKSTLRNISRREALLRLGLSAVAAYVVPEILTISQARAHSGGSLSEPSVPTPPTPPTAPSNVDELESDDTARDHCQNPLPAGKDGVPEISQFDYQKAEASVRAGYAKPLSEIWGDIATEYPGRIIGIDFTGFRWRPRYRLKAISRAGRLETVIVSARTGQIVRIVGC